MEQKTAHKRALEWTFRFFDKALNTIKPPFMKLLIVFVVALILIICITQGDSNKDIMVIILSASVFVIFACLAFALQYLEIKLNYAERTKQELVEGLREEVLKRRKEIRKSINKEREDE